MQAEGWRDNGPGDCYHASQRGLEGSNGPQDRYWKRIWQPPLLTGPHSGPPVPYQPQSSDSLGT